MSGQRQPIESSPRMAAMLDRLETLHGLKETQAVQPLTLIGLTGRKGAGKDTAAAHLVRAHGFRQIALADPIRDGIKAMLGLDDDTLNARALKEIAIDWLGASPRHLMQTLGTEWGRHHVADDLWLRIASRRLDQIRKESAGMPQRVVVSDIRFENEAEWIREQGGIVVHIRRQEAETMADGHASEAGVTLCMDDDVITNDGIPADLFAQLDYLFSEAGG